MRNTFSKKHQVRILEISCRRSTYVSIAHGAGVLMRVFYRPRPSRRVSFTGRFYQLSKKWNCVSSVQLNVHVGHGPEVESSYLIFASVPQQSLPYTGRALTPSTIHHASSMAYRMELMRTGL